MRRLASCVAVIGLAIAVAGCGGNTTPGASGTSKPTISPPNAASVLPVGSPGAIGGTSSPGGSAAQKGSSAPGSSPAPIELPWESTLPVEATISPTCVVPGAQATIVVRTQPKNAVAYHALYAGTKGGAPPPYGYGYGGNDQGHANIDGEYRSTWIVSPDAPPGPARADVIVGNGEAWGYDDPPFAVAGRSGTC